MRHGPALLALLLGLAGLVAFRKLAVEPREWGAVCAAPAVPLACWPRFALLWAQNYYLWGAAALGLGLWAFRGAPPWVAPVAVGLGAAAVINYNATWGMLGAALGAWAWLGASSRA